MSLKKCLVLFLPFLCWQCSDDDVNVVFEMQYPNLQFNIPAGLNTIDAHFFIIRDIPTNKAAFFRDRDESEIIEISPSTAVIRGVQGNLADYSFVDEMVIRICDDNQINESNIFQKCRREIFFREAIPFNTGNRVDLIPNAINLKSELTQDNFTVAVVLNRLRGFSSLEMPSRLELQFQAKR